jgi:uncharacterized metal-binding protein
MADETPALTEARTVYANQETRALAQVAARTEAAGYCKESRVEEVMNFARRLGITGLGIVSCIGLIREARLLHDIFDANGFEVLVCAAK